jgi:uncharacterized DUF497 family protein
VDYLEFLDAGHSDAEDRFIALGPTDRGLIVVAWAERGDAVIRIISARMASRREAELFDLTMRGFQ